MKTRSILATGTTAIALTLVAGACVHFWPDGSPEDSPSNGAHGSLSETLAVEVRLTSVNQEFPPESVHELEVFWTGEYFQFKHDPLRGIWTASAPADLKREERFPRTPTARVTFKGAGAHAIRRDFKGTLSGATLGLQVDVELGTQSLRVRYEDESGRAIPDAQLRVRLQWDGTLEPRDLRTDARGWAVIEHFEYPLCFHVLYEEGLDPHKWNITPDADAEAMLESPPMSYSIVRHPVQSSWLEVSPPAAREQLLDAAENSELLFCLVPLSQPPTRFRRVWSGFEHDLAPAARDSLRESGRIWCGELPACRYWLTVFAPIHFLVSGEVPNPTDWSTGTHAIEFPAGEAHEFSGQLLDDAGKPVVGALVLDGYVPLVALPRILQITSAVAAAGRMATPRMQSVSDNNGRYSYLTYGTASHVTILTRDKQVYHLPKPETGATTELRDDPSDCVASVYVTRQDGTPLQDVLISFTSIDTSAGDDRSDWPMLDEMCDWWRTDARGWVQVRGLLPMQYVFCAVHDVVQDKGRTYRVDAKSIRLVRLSSGNWELTIVASPELEEECDHCTIPGHDHKHDPGHD
jgi:hypothetical protein